MAFLTEKQIEDAIRQTAGNLAAAARKLNNVSRQAIQQRVSNSPHLREIARQVHEEAIDVAEAQILVAIRAGNITACMFFLNNRARHRGYGANPVAYMQNANDEVEAVVDERPSGADMALMKVMNIEELEALSARLAVPGPVIEGKKVEPKNVNKSRSKVRGRPASGGKVA